VKKVIAKQIVREAAAYGECAYRRGYQHGFFAALSGGGKGPNEKAVSDFRHDNKRFRLSNAPPHERRKGYGTSNINRLLLEAESANASLLRAMAEEYFGSL
jgi:hypothetical protein